MRGWHWVLGLVGVLLMAAGSAAPTVAEPTGPDALRQDLDEILADPRLAGSHAGVVIRDPRTDEVLYSRNAQRRATPASNAKLLTSAAAMNVLGPEYRFHTGVHTAARQDGQVLRGDLYLRGSGDPTMLAADYDRLAERVAATGIREIEGRLLTDDSFFDDVRLGTGWAWDDEPYYYAAGVSALTVAPNEDYDAGTVIVRATPGAQGRPAAVRLQPYTEAVRVDNRTTTSEPDAAPDLRVEREHGGDRLVVSGSVPARGEPVEEFSSVSDPTAYAADVFVRALAAHGVTVRGVGSGTVPPRAREIAGRNSMPLRKLLVPFLKLSNNGHAEALTKAMGRVVEDEGSWAAGTRVLADELGDFGIDAGKLRLVDGSGLSSMDAVTPGQLATLLDNVRQRPWFRLWHDALPVAGHSDRLIGGTLRSRMVDTPAEGNVHAKTGSLTGVSSLSGYVTAANGRPLVFSVIFNDYVSDAPTNLEDAVAVRLANYRGADDRSTDVRVPRQSAIQDDPTTRLDESTVECSWRKAC